MNRRLELTVGTVWVALSLAAIVAGSLGPWATVGPFSVSGTSRDDGLIALCAGLVAVVAVAVPRIPAFVALAAAVVAAGIAVYYLAAIFAIDDTLLGSVRPGWGLVVVLAGGVSLAVWTLLQEAARPRWLLSAVSAVAVALIAGAGVAGATSGSADTPDKAKLQTTTTDAETNTDTEPDTEPEPAASSQSAEVGEALTLTGGDGVEVLVSVVGVRDPLQGGEFDSVPEGKRMVGVSLRLTNQSATETYDDSPSNGAKLVYGDGLQADSAFAFGSCKAQSVTIAPGDSRRICIPFEVGANDTLTKFQFALDSGFSDESGEWLISNSTPPSSAVDTPSVAGAADIPPESSLTRCDQNIRAGPQTTCGFADAVFIEYARLLQAGETQETVSLRAKSPATGQRYSVTCQVTEDDDVQCRAGDGAYVQFPQRAAAVY